MELIKLTDCEGVSHYLNKRYIISVRPYDSLDDRDSHSKVEYGVGWVDCIYMKEKANVIAGIIEGTYFK